MMEHNLSIITPSIIKGPMCLKDNWDEFKQIFDSTCTSVHGDILQLPQIPDTTYSVMCEFVLTSIEQSQRFYDLIWYWYDSFRADLYGSHARMKITIGPSGREINLCNVCPTTISSWDLSSNAPRLNVDNLYEVFVRFTGTTTSE